MKRIFILVSVLLISLSSFTQLPKLTFTPHWLPQAQFAGYYVAKEKGFYENKGIDVTIKHPSASVMATEKLMNEEADIISLFLITAIAAKENGADLVNIGQLSQHSALLFVSKKEKGVKEIENLEGRKIGIWESGFDEIPKAMINRYELNVDWVPILSSVNLFLIGGIDAMTVMWYNEYDQIINSGVNADELCTIFFKDHGFDIPEDGIYCLNKTFLQRKGDLKKFVEATIEGWEYARDNKEETLEIVLDIMRKEYAPTNKAHQSWMLDRMLELVEPGEKTVEKGRLSLTDFEAAKKCLIDYGQPIEHVTFDSFNKPVLK